MGELHDGGYSAQQLVDGGYTVEQLLRFGFPVQKLRDCGWTVHELRKKGVSDEHLTQAGFRVFALQVGVCQSTGQIAVTCHDQSGLECASALMSSASTLMQLTQAVERDLGESILLMLPSGRVFGLADEGTAIHDLQIQLHSEQRQQQMFDDYLF